MSTSDTMTSRHPRRGRVINSPPPSLLASSETPSASRTRLRMKKGDTFHYTTSSPSDGLLLNLPLLPRSPTSPGALEAIAAGQERMSKILGRIESGSFRTRGRFDEEDESSDSNDSLEAHFQRLKLSKEDLDKRFAKKNRRTHCHASDSGLGTSISSRQSSSSKQEKAGKSASKSQTLSAVLSSIQPAENEAAPKQKLSPASCLEIENRILKPLLGMEPCKPFRHIVEGARQQMESDKFRTLRDLEKALLYVAADVEAELSFYYQFCNSTILCLHETYTTVDPRDLCMPADRPYSNSYFLDLTAQVHRFKAMRDEARKNKEEMPKLVVEGGMDETGRPLELVVEKDGEMISLESGKPYDALAVPMVKRTLSLGATDEGARRSMARRKKNAPPMNINTKCSHCDKIFQRPCDLTKHEKTHSRPFKCPFEGCKYYELGWPTEKENERHINDRHSSTPRMYACTFNGCSYKSKRESNCKQHMEKAHGWNYVRAKNNGRNAKRRPSPVQASPAQDSVAQPSPQQLSPGQASSVNLAPSQMTPLRMSPDHMSSLPMIPDHLDSLQMTPEHYSPEHYSPENYSPERYTPEHYSPSNQMHSVQLSPAPISSGQLSPAQASHTQASTPASGPIQSPTGFLNTYAQSQMFQLQDPFTQLKNEDCLLYMDNDFANDFATFNNGTSGFFEDASFGYTDPMYQPGPVDMSAIEALCDDPYMNNVFMDTFGTGTGTDESMFPTFNQGGMPQF
ncbi:C2H2 transcription factor [Aspergillus indologenus CBS 114.80]|uniref:C2H2 transcription factor n=1 Tax=Aspergillus indologenus CBS 114.80 TaxID=1450541 RepID=A0A2V5HKB7_9EURO|nr:C2H2 transcription factor [Aspergillus indologenus CBS 114.80]